MYESITSVVCYVLAAAVFLAQPSHAASPQFTYSNATYDVPSWNDTTSIDMIYPRNETYAPQALFPVVVHLGHPNVASYLQMRLQYQLYRQLPLGGEVSWVAAEFEVGTGTGSGPYWLSGLRNKTLVDGHYRMLLTAMVANCSVVPNRGVNHPTELRVDTNFRHDENTERSAEVYFTIANSSTTAMTDDTVNDRDTCGRRASLAFRVTDYVPRASDSDSWYSNAQPGGLPFCAVLSDRDPESSLCEYPLDYVSKSFNDTITEAECKQDRPVIKCPKPTSAAALESMDSAMLAWVGCLATWALLL